jgi:transcriptional regulator with XRE-family HTH domain
MLGSMLRRAREVAGLSYDQAAARLGGAADWLVRLETGLVVAAPEQVARILVEYGVREAAAADAVIDMARRVVAPPPWLARHTSRMSAAARGVLLVEAEATLVQVYGVRLVPPLVQAEGYFRQIAPKLFLGCDVDQELGPALPPPGTPARRGDQAAGRDHRLKHTSSSSSSTPRPLSASSATCSPWPKARTPPSASSPRMRHSAMAVLTSSTSCPSPAPQTGSASPAPSWAQNSLPATCTALDPD